MAIMPFFKKSKSSSNNTLPASPAPSRYSARSEEQLAAHPAFAAPLDHGSTSSIEDAYSDRRFPDSRFTQERLPGSEDTPHYRPVTQPPSVTRSQSQRQPHQSYRDRPSVSVIAPEEPQPRRSKKGFFSRSSSRGVERSTSVKGNSVSVKGKTISHPISQPTSPRVPHSLETTHEERQHHRHPAYSEDHSSATRLHYESRSESLTYQQEHQQVQRASRENLDWQPPASAQPQSRPFPPSLVRSSTDPSLVDKHNRPSPTDSTSELPHYPDQGYRGRPHSHAQQDLVNSRPPSRQTVEPPSPVRSQNHPDAMQQAQGQQAPNDRSQGSQPDPIRRSSTSQNMPEPSRNTPSQNRIREDPSEIDVRALLQKHEELQSKYSKVKRYYFDKEAQVQHLQNTVAHQRMAVSRTVLDDNEYANRFQRLDGAIKDLAFSVRKEWRGLPSWLHGLVTDDAISTGTKEMTALGRAVISRWLVEEVFQRHFHPGLEPGLSLALNRIEMNLRRQQMRPATDEDRENAIARLSNWRRTTFDGLGDMLADPAAQEHRAELIEHLTVELASFLSTQLHDPAPQELEGGVRMIIENTINIAEKIPLEARDVCVEYFPPNIAFMEGYMKVEGQLPPLSHQPSPPADLEADDPATAEGDASPNSQVPGAADGASSTSREPRRRTVFGALMGRKSVNESSRSAGGQTSEEKGEQEGSNRIRFASFVTVEVRGKGPPTVLVKAPVFLLE